MEIIALLAAVAVVVWLVMSYNGLVSLNQRVDQAFADIDVQLKQRHDLIPNLLSSVRGYMEHERGVLDAVVKARNEAVSAHGPARQIPAEQALGQAVGNLFALAENYPDLKANTTFLDLQQQLGQVEDKLSAARRFFNNAVSEFNAALDAIPTFLFARLLTYQPRAFFDVGSAQRAEMQAPLKVSF